VRYPTTSCLLHLQVTRRRESAAKTPAVIEISSSEDDDQGATARPSPAKCAHSHSKQPPDLTAV